MGRNLIMEALREVTVWSSPNASNHTYLIDSMNLIAYIKQGDKAPFFFKNPIKGFDKRGRKFVPVDLAQFGQIKKPDSIEVKGSSGIYIVDKEAKTCTCPGFMFRRSCKHIVAIK